MIRTVDVTCIITPEDISEASLELTRMFDEDITCKNKEVAPNQTHPILFESSCNCFINIRRSFVYACSQLLNCDMSNRHAAAWAYRAKGRSCKQDRDKHWHTHDIGNIDLSGVLYLKANFNEVRSGTEFFIENKFFNIKPEPFTWVLFPPYVRHRPGFNFFGATRLSIAADLHKK